MKFIYFFFFTILIVSCDRKSTTFKKFLNDDHLASQVFNININRDTTLITRNGCIIKLPKGSLESDDENVKLDIKEALTATDIVLAGLTTQSNGQALSSGGMIYFNAASGYNITIKKAVEILVPTNTYNRDMKVYKGEKDSDDKTNWKDPSPLPQDSSTQQIKAGEAIFNSYCASCHKMYAEFTGPAMYGVTDRHSKKWLYDFTRHATDILYAGQQVKADSLHFQSDPYVNCLYSRYNSVMTAFPAFTDEDLDRVYGYIKSETDKRPDLKSVFGKTCCDSCVTYNQNIRSLNNEKEDLINDNNDFFTLERDIPLPEGTTRAIDTTTQPYSKVSPSSAKAVYYTINISATGWYNIDILMKDYSACQPSELFVRIQGNYDIELNVVLVIPAVKAFVEGGKLKNSPQYGFDEDNGEIPLPQNMRAYIMGFAEYDNKIIFGKAAFNTQLKQTIDLPLSETTKEKMRSEIKALNLDGITTDIERSENAEKIVKIEKDTKALEKLKPGNCDCGSNATNPMPSK